MGHRFKCKFRDFEIFTKEKKKKKKLGEKSMGCWA